MSTLAGTSGRRLYRDADRAKLGGVCAGLSTYLGFNLCVTRFLCVMAFLCVFPFALIAYLAAVILIPARSSRVYDEFDYEARRKEALREENKRLRDELENKYRINNIIGNSNKMREVFQMISQVSKSNATVLIRGESGTGKELVASAIHKLGPRRKGPFIKVNCAALSESLLESELFGHERGAFTGAVKDKAGIFDIAKHGSLFLDEVANLNLDIQAKLLRAIESREFKPVGADRQKKSDVRIIAATNKDLKMMVDGGKFREDFFYRLNVFPIFIPPLRERRDDIPRLLYHFLKLYCRQTGKRVDGFSDDALEMLINHEWPGNVRQLKNVVERLVIIADDRILDSQNLDDHWEIKSNHMSDAVPKTLEELKSVKRQLLENQFGKIEKNFLQKALAIAEGNIAQAARQVGMQRSNFSVIMKKNWLSANRIDSVWEPILPYKFLYESNTGK